MTLNVTDLIYGYSNGIFPMADEAGNVHWYAPDPRAIIPLESYKISRSLRPLVNRSHFEIKIDQNFEAVMRGCARPRFDGDATWISEDFITAYCELHELGLAHSVEAFLDGELVGGLYGVALGGAYFGESMFHFTPNASKVAFHYLIEILKRNNYQLLDTQFINDNVLRLGAVEIPRAKYEQLLFQALPKKCQFKL